MPVSSLPARGRGLKPRNARPDRAEVRVAPRAGGVG